jgi:hypothetical protein
LDTEVWKTILEARARVAKSAPKSTTLISRFNPSVPDEDAIALALKAKAIYASYPEEKRLSLRQILQDLTRLDAARESRRDWEDYCAEKRAEAAR